MERLDNLENGYMIWQDPEAFCYGIDAVLLSHFPAMKDGDKVLDMCSGNGVIPLIMHAIARDEKIHADFSAIEIQTHMADLARKSVEYNGLAADIRIVNGDVKEAQGIFGPASFSLITCNPPYMIAEHGLTGGETPKAIARHEIKCTLEDVVSQAARLLKPGGRFAMIHRPFRLAEIIVTLKQYGLEPKRMRMVHPFWDSEPSTVLVEAVKGGKPRLSVGPPVIVFNGTKEGSRAAKPSYSDEILHIYGREWEKQVTGKGDQS